MAARLRAGLGRRRLRSEGRRARAPWPGAEVGERADLASSGAPEGRSRAEHGIFASSSFPCGGLTGSAASLSDCW